MAKVHSMLELWQGSENLRATQKQSRVQYEQMTAMGTISGTEEFVNASWSPFQHDGAASFKLSGRSALPPPLSAKDLPGGGTQILNVHQIWRINRHPVEGDEDSAPESISNTEDWFNWNGYLDSPHDSEDDCAADFEPHTEQDNGIEDAQCSEPQDVIAAPIVLRLSRPTRKSKREAEKVLMTVNAIETRRNNGQKKKYDRMGQCFTSFFMYLDREF